MAFLPEPINHDLFLSYAYEDDVWVSELQEQLAERLVDKLATDCDVWQDKNKLLTDQNIPEELDKAIRASAAFIAVLSRNYPASKWCERELAAFLNEAEKKDGLETGGHGRLLKVIKYPWIGNAHEGFCRAYKAILFFERDPKTGREREFNPKSARFKNAVEELSSDIERLFQAMLLGLEKVFVARAADDVTEERESLIREIRAAGFAISPPPQGAIPKWLDCLEIRKYIREATRVSVHLLGASYDPAVREQIDDAREEGKMLVFYLARGHEKATGEQRALIEEVRANNWDLPAESRDLLANRSKLEDLIKLLQPQCPQAVGVQNGAARVYVLCDPTSPEDAGFGRELQGKIRDKEKFDVILPQAAAGSSSPGSEHDRLLASCDGLLLYRPRVLTNWYERHFKDFVAAEYRARERQLKSKALLAADPDVKIEGLTVIPRSVPVELKQLEPFLAPLRTGQGEAAHAGS